MRVAPAVADPRDDPRLVVRGPVADAVAEPLGDGVGVLDERLGGRALGPAARVLERLRRVPVEERHERLDPVPEQLVDEPVVEVEPGRVDAAAAVRQDARPRDREAERVEAELAHQADVVAVAVVEVAGDRAGLAVPHLARRGAERSQMLSPRPSSVAAPSIWYDGRRGAPEEVGGERASLSWFGHRVPLGWRVPER